MNTNGKKTLFYRHTWHLWAWTQNRLFTENAADETFHFIIGRLLRVSVCLGAIHPDI